MKWARDLIWRIRGALREAGRRSPTSIEVRVDDRRDFLTVTVVVRWPSESGKGRGITLEYAQVWSTQEIEQARFDIERAAIDAFETRILQAVPA